MEGTAELSKLKNLAFMTGNSRHAPVVSPFSSFLSSTGSSSISNSLLFEPKEGLHYHQRCSSESFLIEEQPSWLDDLLNDSGTFIHRGHRRSASDSYAYSIREESKFINAYIETKTNSSDEIKNNQETEELVSVEQSSEEPSSQNHEGSANKAPNVKQSASKTDTKRAKQHNAHRSRVRKLQYISHLERTVQMLQTEGSEVSAELEFIEQQNIILTMENRALRQRLESLSQEQIIKHWEQEMLEREIGRLQTLCHLQKQQQLQLQQNQQPQQHPKQRRSRSKDLDQVNNFPMKKNKEPSSSNGSVNGSIRT